MTGISWKTYWSLTGPERAALDRAVQRINERTKRTG